MSNIAWRTVVTRPHESLYLRNNQMIVSQENPEQEDQSIPVEQIREILIDSSMGNISLPLLQKLAEQNTKVLFCDRQKNPLCELHSLYSNFETAGRIMDQAAWTNRKKSAVWRQIVKMKISQQTELLHILGMEIPCQMREYRRQIESDDETNREAMASKVYFNALFGSQFKRFSPDTINAGLNYGYAILRSAFSREIVMMGYSTALGIHHCSRQNPYNFSCDLMEPFRPFVDRIVWTNQNRELNWEYREELIRLLYTECIYNGKTTDIQTAIQFFVRDITYGMEMPRYQIKEIHFEKTQGRNRSHV